MLVQGRTFLLVFLVVIITHQLQGFFDTQFDDKTCLVPSQSSGIIFYPENKCIAKKYGEKNFVQLNSVSSQLEYNKCSDDQCKKCDTFQFKLDSCVNTTEINHEKFTFDKLHKDASSYYVYIYYGKTCTSENVAKVQLIPAKCNGPYQIGNDLMYIQNHCNEKEIPMTSYYHTRDCSGSPYDELELGEDCQKMDEDFYSQYSCKELY